MIIKKQRLNIIIVEKIIVTALLTQISWTNRLAIMSKAKTIEERHFYITLCIKVDTGSANLGATHVEENVSGSFLMQGCILKIDKSLSDWRKFMGNRTRDRIIYIRTNEKLQAEFENKKKPADMATMQIL